MVKPSRRQIFCRPGAPFDILPARGRQIGHLAHFVDALKSCVPAAVWASDSPVPCCSLFSEGNRSCCYRMPQWIESALKRRLQMTILSSRRHGRIRRHGWDRRQCEFFFDSEPVREMKLIGNSSVTGGSARTVARHRLARSSGYRPPPKGEMARRLTVIPHSAARERRVRRQ